MHSHKCIDEKCSNKCIYKKILFINKINACKCIYEKSRIFENHDPDRVT